MTRKKKQSDKQSDDDNVDDHDINCHAAAGLAVRAYTHPCSPLLHFLLINLQSEPDKPPAS